MISDDPLAKYLAANERLQEARLGDGDTDDVESKILAEMAVLWEELTPEQKQRAEQLTAIDE